MPLFSGHGLTCFRGGRIVFAGLDFAIEPGGALILVGPNGSGKSSLLRLMTGLLRPLAGRVRWDGEDIAEEPETHNGRIHYVGHLDAVKPAFTVTENLAFWAGLRDGGGAVQPALDAFGIGHLSDVPGRFLSAGQRRRLNLARLKATPGSLWLLDEPATALDSRAVGHLRTAIADHRSGGGMVAAATHADLGLDAADTLDLAKFEAEAVA